MSTAVCMYLLLSGFFRGRLVSSQAPVWFHSFSEVWYTMICGYALPGNYRSRDYSLPRRFKKEESNPSLESNTRSIPLNLILFLHLTIDRPHFFFKTGRARMCPFYSCSESVLMQQWPRGKHIQQGSEICKCMSGDGKGTITFKITRTM